MNMVRKLFTTINALLVASFVFASPKIVAAQDGTNGTSVCYHCDGEGTCNTSPGGYVSCGYIYIEGKRYCELGNWGCGTAGSIGVDGTARFALGSDDNSSGSLVNEEELEPGMRVTRTKCSGVIVARKYSSDALARSAAQLRTIVL